MSHIQNTHNNFPMNHHNLFMFSPLEPAGNWVTISHCWSNVMMNSSSFPDTHCTLGKLGGVGQPHNRTVFVHFTFLRHFNLWCCWTNYELLNILSFHMFKLQFFGSQKLDCVVQTTTGGTHHHMSPTDMLSVNIHCLFQPATTPWHFLQIFLSNYLPTNEY